MVNHGGTYQIRNVLNGKLYIGSAKNFQNRWMCHQNALRKQKHHSIKLQRAWNKHGEEAFVFEVISRLPSEMSYHERLVQEQLLLDALKPHKVGYNISGLARGVALFGSANSFFGKTHSPEVRERLRQARNGKRLSEGTRKKISTACVGKGMFGKSQTPEARKRISEAMQGHKRCSGRKLSRGTRDKIQKGMRRYHAL